MVNEQIDNALKCLFGAFGRKPLKEQIDVYMEWADAYSPDMVKNIVTQAINHEERLPTIAKLKKIAMSLLGMKRSFSNNDYDDCWICDSTGQVPALSEPTEFNSVHHIRNYGCKCSKGERIGISGYFSKYDNLQFEEEAKESPHMNYPQLVEFIKNQRNKEMKQDTNNWLETQSVIIKENI